MIQKRAATLTGISLAGTNLTLTGSNRISGPTYQVLTKVLASTNVALPRSAWWPVATNVLDASGNFSLTATNAVSPADLQKFFMLQLP